ncbi:uncharacterized protein LOC142231205 [Haematobia irritans]|uniref:uncharacterized protein LOC142231205 n=1 Tax=Haematobia irritans TaxID=7368 RepID=UPI003F50550C
MPNEPLISQTTAAFVKPPKPLQITGNNVSTSWKSWIQQYRWFATAAELEMKSAQIQVATFMSSIGADAVNVFNSFSLGPEEKKDIKIIEQRFEDYFAPKISVTFERYKFNTLYQNEGETFEEYFTKIKNQAKKCEFGQIEDSLLRDKIVVGIGNDSVREKLLSEDDIDLAKAIKICRASEMATQQLKELHKNDDMKVDAIRKYAKPKSFKKTSSNEQTAITYDCKRCGRQHESRNCPAFNSKCRNCQRRGHYSKFCFQNKRNGTKLVNSLQQNMSAESDSDSDLLVLTVRTSETNKDGKDNWYEEITIDKKKIKFKLDTAAQCNVIPLSVLDKGQQKYIQSVNNKLIAFGGAKIDVHGEIFLTCIVRNKKYNASFFVVKDFPNLEPLLGKNDCERFSLILRVNEVMFDKQIFDGLGKVKNFIYDIDLVENPSFEHYAPRRIPHALKEAVKKEIDNMVKLGVLVKTDEITPAVSPMVIVKQKGKIRLCIDPTDINKNIQRRYHPLNTIDEITANIKNSKWFTLLDCKKGFWQIEVSERTQKYLTMATPWGRYSFRRLPFGLASAPEVYQNLMSQLLEHMPNTEVSMDDILIHAVTKEQLERQTAEVMDILSKLGLKLNKEKCIFNVNKVKFLGHILTSDGIAPDPQKVSAINQLKIPENKVELQRILGMATYLSKFITNFSEITAPLRHLLKKDVEWCWLPQHESAFKKLKDAFSSTPLLRYYDPNLDVKLQVDASKYSVGAALLQNDQPVAYASKALTKAQQNYAQIEKEATAIRFACEKFHEYIYGKKLTIETDHKPLETIFKKPLYSAPQRLQSILLYVMPYSPHVVYRKGSEIKLADTLSRDCLNKQTHAEEKLVEVHVVSNFTTTTKERIKRETANDTNLRTLQTFILKHSYLLQFCAFFLTWNQYQNH